MKTNVEKKVILVQRVISVMLCALIFLSIYNVNLLQGTARVINYAGIIRGATQRVIKMEIAGTPMEDEVDRLSTILVELRSGGDTYGLVRLTNRDYQHSVQVLQGAWNTLRKEIEKVRTVPYTETDIIAKSEEFFKLADATVSDAERYSQHIAASLAGIEYTMAGMVLVLLTIMFYNSWKSGRLEVENSELSHTAYLDKHTGLPNKSRCEELILAPEFLDKNTCCMMFDLNDLKKTNDSMGHQAGDLMIQNFARILRLTVPEKDFVGRFGGDEFLVILRDISEVEVKTVRDNMRVRVNNHNNKGSETSNCIHLSYAMGYAFSGNYEDVTMRTLLEKADYEMYKNKAAIKAARVKQP